MKSPAKIATFLYHDIADDPTTSGFQRRSAMAYKQSQSVFAEHLERIADSGCAPGSVEHVDFEKFDKHVLVTFDDGGKGALSAAEELNRRGWKGHFFITTSLLGTPTFLDRSETRYLQSCGHIIGSHSHTHPDIFKALSFEQMLIEWRTSKSILEDVLGAPCTTASVPGGDVSRMTFRSANEAGLRFLFTSDPYLNPFCEGNCWILGRICPSADAPLEQIQDLAKFRGWSKEAARVRLKTSVKTALFPLYRLYVRYALHS